MRYIILIALLFAAPAQAAVVYSDSWDYTYVKKDLYNNSLSYNDSAPDYCVNPDPPDNCSISGLGCDQLIGPPIAISAIPEATCKHSINIGPGRTDGWPLAIDGPNSLRYYIDINDAAVKGHHGGRSELFCNEGELNATGRDRWYGYAMYFPPLAVSNFTYNEHGWQQFKNKYVGTGSSVPMYFWINGGVEHQWREQIEFRIWYSNHEVTNGTLVPTQAAIDAGRLSGSVDNNPGIIIKNTAPNGTGSIDDLGQWMYIVMLYHHDYNPATTEGKFKMWYASQDMIDTCGMGMECYLLLYDETNFATGRTENYPDTNIIRMGADQPSPEGMENRKSYMYPVISYRDNFKVGDGLEATEALNFADVNPAVQSTQYTLTVSKAGTGSGTVTSSPSGIDCGSDCSQSYQENTVITLTQNAALESEFAGWSGDCTGLGACEVTMSAARNVTAIFNETGESTGHLRGISLRGVTEPAMK